MDNNNMFNQGPQQVQQPYQQQYQNDSNLEEPVSFGDWMLSMLLMMIPCVNIVMMFVYAFGKDQKKSKSNFFKATLVWYLIAIVLSVIIIAVFGASLIAMMSSMGYY